MKKFMYIFMIFIFLLNTSISSEIITLIDVPTAYTLLRGYYNIDFLNYGNGGILTRIAIGLTDRITLGIIEDIDNAIGKEKPDWNIPGVMAKINILYPDSNKTGVAIGYDVLLMGEYGKVYNNEITDDLVYGAYIAFTKPVSLFSGQQFWHFGIRFPILPPAAREKGKNISLYTGLSININSELLLIGEIENIYLTGNRGAQTIYNTGIKYWFSEYLNVGLNFQYTSAKSINPDEKVSRSLKLEYQNIFY